MTLTLFLGGIILVFAAWNAILDARRRTLTSELQHAVGLLDAEHALSLHTLATVKDLEQEADIRNAYLDYLFTTFRLHVADPYVDRPTFEEKRCYHCHYPNFAGHDAACPWVHCRPLTEVLYPPATVSTSATTATDADTVIQLPEAPPAPDLPLHEPATQ